MKIKKVTIYGYRSIKEPLELELKDVNAIIGGNNVGKSNILKAIWTVLGRDWVTVNNFCEDDVYLRDGENDIKITIEFDEPYKYHQFQGIDPIDIPKISFTYTKYKIGENIGQRRLEKQCLNKSDKPVNVLAKKPQKGEQRQYQPLTTIPQDIQKDLHVIFIGMNRNLKYQLPGSKNSILEILLRDINTDFENPDNKMQIKNSKGETIEISRIDRFKQCIKCAIESLRTDQLNELEKTIKNNALRQLGFNTENDNENLNIYFNPLTSIDFYTSLQIYVKENDFEINATELGGGFQNALVIAILKAFEERRKSGALFLIEEPEMFLHPQMQRSLYKTIRSISENNQIIYTTHSPHFVTIPEYDEIFIISKDENGTVKHKSTLQKTTQIEEKLRKELDPERSELFFAKRVLLVEGDTEKLSLPEYAKRENLDFDNMGSSIIEVTGKRNLKTFADLVLSFNIPLGFIYDIDSSEISDKNEEKKLNQELEDYKNKGVNVWSFNKKYEDELKNALGENSYQKACQKYSKSTKPIKARLIASDTQFSVPDFVKPIIKWLANKS
ncbi:hypothetical protein AMJ49_05205 [Parcubacteria bacterium DG_74_2]|nr:MAG: hypothetical protein AMJ49_05205 [Parcubacteria bacterium DG_74_2]